ncbi:hypothetical protein EOM60_05930 [Candidatus Saccharibacteria bacterium]|nr:hypothetical protein [Candidatus Saccharibacteria bacterium]
MSNAAKKLSKQVLRSSGRTAANNLAEQLFMKQVKSNPLSGAKHLKNIIMNDSRWLASKGWIKMEQTKILKNGSKVVIHFVYNTITRKTADFKFK